MNLDLNLAPFETIKHPQSGSQKRLLTGQLDAHTVYENTVHQEPSTMSTMPSLTAKSVYCGQDLARTTEQATEQLSVRLTIDKAHVTLFPCGNFPGVRNLSTKEISL
jgi:hypothetical protein